MGEILDTLIIEGLALVGALITMWGIAGAIYLAYRVALGVLS